MTESRLMTLLGALADQVPSHFLAQAEADVGHGEYGMALENLCERMYDVNTSLRAAQIATIEALATELRIRPERWEFVKTLAAPDRSET